MARVTISSNNLFPGPKGQKGDTGAQGIQGPKGDTGDTGAQGPSGIIAVTSPITNSGTSTSATIGINQSLISIAQSQVTNLTSDLANKAGLALANTFTAAQTATSFIVTGSTVPTNGMYLPAANTLGFATNGGSRLQINSVGEIGISATPVTGFSVQIEKNITGATASYGINNVGFILSGVTSSATYYRTFARTANANFGITAILHYDAAAVGTFDNVTAGGSVTAQYGFRVTNTLTGATSNFGFYGDIPSAANRWNFYANGTAANYFAGQTTVGSTSLTLGSGSAAQQFGVVAGAATRVGAVIRGAASQTANLQEWQNSAGSILAVVDFLGTIKTRYFADRADTGAYIEMGATSPVRIDTRSSTNKGLVVQGVASQTANLQEWQNSAGTVLSRIDSNGNYRTATQQISIGSLTSGNYTAFVNSIATSWPVIITRGAASQTANLQEWQNSAGTILQRVTSGGTMRGEGAADQFAIVSSDSNGTSFRFESTATNGRVWRLGHNFVVGGGEFSLYDSTSAVERLNVSNTGNFGFNGRSYGSGTLVIFIANATTVPSTNPTGGGVLYVEAGALKYRGSSGTITTIANA